MTTSPYVLVLRKDLRRFLPWAALLLASIVLNRFVAPHFVTTNLKGLVFWMSLLPWPLVLVGGLILGQEDRAIGDQAFWHTRPLPGLALVAAKLTALFLLIILPAAAADMIRASQHDVHGFTLVLIGLERAMLFGAIASIGLYLGATNTSLLRCLAAIIGIALVVFILAFTADSIRIGGTRLDLSNLGVTSSDRMIVLFVSFTLFAIALSTALYVTRRAHLIAVLAGFGSIVISLSAWAWPYPILPTPASLPAPAPAPSAVADPVDLTFTGPTQMRIIGRSNSSEPVVTLALLADASVSPAATFLSNLQCSGQITLPDGTTHPLSNRYQTAFNPFQLTTRAIHQTLGIPPPSRPQQLAPAFSLRGIRLPLRDLIRFTGQPMTFDFNLTYDANRISLDDRMPLAKGASVARNGYLKTVTGIFSPGDGGGLRISLFHSRVTSLFAPFGELRPDQLQSNRLTDLVVLIHRTTGAVSTGKIEGRSNSLPPDETFPCAKNYLVFRSAYVPGTTDHSATVPVDDSWRNNSDIVFLHSISVGQYTQHYHLENVLVPRPVIDLLDLQVDLTTW